MKLGAVATKLAFVAFAGLSLSGCLGNTRPDAAFPDSVRVNPPRGGAPVVIAGRVESSKISIATLERRVVLTANGSEIGRATFPDARIASAATTPVAINAVFQGVPIAASCENHEFREPSSERRGIFHRLTFAEINCQVSYAGRPAGTMTMMHSPHGTIVQPAAVTAAAR